MCVRASLLQVGPLPCWYQWLRRPLLGGVLGEVGGASPAAEEGAAGGRDQHLRLALRQLPPAPALVPHMVDRQAQHGGVLALCVVGGREENEERR